MALTICARLGPSEILSALGAGGMYEVYLAEQPHLKRTVALNVIYMILSREMRETYSTRDGSTIQGRAAYAKFRRYHVRVNEKLAPIK